MATAIAGETANGQSKVDRYKWKPLGKPGEFRLIPKKQLHIDSSYQRTEHISKVNVLKIASEFDWVQFGVLLVALRTDGTFWIYDGQHRWLATLRRGDIDVVPCLVFEVDSLPNEAKAFLGANICRKPMPALPVLRAKAVAGDDIGQFVIEYAATLGLRFSDTASKYGEIKCAAACVAVATKSKDRFRDVLCLAAGLCREDDLEIQRVLLLGLAFLHERLEPPLMSEKVKARVVSCGAAGLLAAAKRQMILEDKSGEAVWGRGMLREINKLGRTKYRISETGDKQQP